MDQKCKVFGIGFHKTGTTSLAVALYILGYNVTGYFGAHDDAIAEKVYDYAFKLADRFDAAQDTPWPVLYKELDKRYPASKFILTVRQSDQWIESVVKHFKDQYIPLHVWIYGVTKARGNEASYLRRYEAHNRDVMEYFKDRPNDLLIMDITKGDGWEKLCPFLGIAVPPLAFPVTNRASERASQLWRRGSRVLMRQLIPNKVLNLFRPVHHGVSAEFVRDLVAYHYSLFDTLWDGVQQLSEEQFTQPISHTGSSVYVYMVRQIKEEATWLRRLKGELSVEGAELALPFTTKAALYKCWNENRFLLRAYVADLTDETCNTKVSVSNASIWEVFIHLVVLGIQQTHQIQQCLQDFGITIEVQTFMSFFHKS